MLGWLAAQVALLRILGGALLQFQALSRGAAINLVLPNSTMSLGCSQTDTSVAITVTKGS